MLNELATLRASLERYNVGHENSHPWVKRMSKSATLVVGLGADGLVHSLEMLYAEEAGTLFKIQPNFHCNFPGVNVDPPIWELDADASRRWQETPVSNVRNRIVTLREAAATGKLTKKSLDGLRRIRKDAGLLRPRFREDDARFAAFQAVLSRVLLSEGADEAWYRSMTEAALRAAESGDAKLLDLVESLFIRKSDKKVQLIFDVADYVRFSCRVADPRMKAHFSRELLASEDQSGEMGICSLTGRRTVIETQPLPSPNLPVLGPTSLMSMNEDTPCQARYGRIGREVFRIGRQTAIELNDALGQLTAANMEFKTWQKVPGNRKKVSNLLIVFLRDTPLSGDGWTGLLSEPEDAKRTYTQLCADLAKSLEGRDSHGNDDLLEILVLRKIDKGRAQIELARSVSAAQVVEGGRGWERAARNLPETLFRRWPEVPFPSEVVRLTQQQWIRGGKETTDAPGCRLGEVYDVLVGDERQSKDAAKALLELVLKRTTPLLVESSHSGHRETKTNWKSFARGADLSASVAAAVLAITLHKLEIQKEEYMQGAAYQLGRFLSLADTLHRRYCVAVRDGQVPPQLLGNSMLPAVAKNPIKGLAQMFDRLRVYRAWAERGGDGLARWSVAEMGKLCPSLAEQLPERMGDVEKAELLLGYLARSESKQDENEGSVE